MEQRNSGILVIIAAGLFYYLTAPRISGADGPPIGTQLIPALPARVTATAHERMTWEVTATLSESLSSIPTPIPWVDAPKPEFACEVRDGDRVIRTISGKPTSSSAREHVYRLQAFPAEPNHTYTVTVSVLRGQATVQERLSNLTVHYDPHEYLQKRMKLALVVTASTVLCFVGMSLLFLARYQKSPVL